MGIAEVVYKRGQGRQPLMLESSQDADTLIDALRADARPGGVPHNLAQIYSLRRSPLPSGRPDHELLVGIDGEREVGLLSFMDAAGNVVTAGDAGEPFAEYFLAGNITVFEAQNPMELPIDDIRHAVHEFLTTGERPNGVHWQELL